MCGICGKLNFSQDEPVDRGLIQQMCRILSHRGPDDEGAYIKRNIGLGHRRLSIIDLTPAGHQPMCNEDSTVWIVFNGEIYNYLELRKGLEAKGHRFTSSTDTETIIHLYEEEGVNCLKSLRGMFAFAIYDERNGRLFLARDRVGKKPLVYALKDNFLLFASEIKALLLDPAIKREVDYATLHHYLTYEYCPSPLTIFKGISKLPPAHFLTWERGKVRIERYWNLSYREKLILPDEEAYGERFKEIFEESVKIRLMSDVPLGAFLSGGIDSSATVAFMSRLNSKPVKTFSIGFEEEEYNELSYARMVADRFQTDHHEFMVKPDAVEILPKLVYYYNEPFADSSAIPTYYVSKLTREHVTVALNGDGGDESFAGYERYIADRLAGYYQIVPAILREKIIRRLVEALPHSENRRNFFRRLKRFVRGISDQPERRYVRWICFFDNEMKEDLYCDEFKELIKGIDSFDLTVQWYEKADGNNFLDRTLFVDVMSYLPEDLLVKVDIASMTNSLEARSPFLDHKLMEFAASLPSKLKLNRVVTKYLLKQSFKGILPEEVLGRKKMGFGVPLDRWFRTDLKEMVCDTLLSSSALQRGYFKSTSIESLLNEHITLKADHSYRIWALLFLELWHRMFIDRWEVKIP
jgi:asparagine synthase (glutamine-hydrolysing)